VAIPGDDDDAFYLFLQLHLKLSTGYTGPNGGPCTACWVLMYKNTTGSATCTTCPGNSSSAAGSTDLNSCVCNVGYTSVSSSPCLPYVAGTYTTSTGNSTCTVCPVGSSSAVTSTALIQCVCNAGYAGANCLTCTVYGGGKYKTVTGTATCTDYITGTNSAVEGASLASTCYSCPLNSQSSSESTICVCMTGQAPFCCTHCLLTA